MKGRFKDSVSEETKARFSKDAYNHIKPINNTVSLFYTNDTDSDPKGMVFILDRDTFLIKEEGFVPMLLSDFLHSSDIILATADMAAWCNDFRYSRITMISEGVEDGDALFDVTSKSVNDPNLLKDFNVVSYRTLKDVFNLLKVNGADSL